MKRGPRLLAPAAAWPLTLALQGCGFTPLYAERGLASGLADVQIVSDHDREGYLLVSAFNDEAGRNDRGGGTYRLETKLHATRAPEGIRVNNVANRYEINLTVAYRLVEVASGRVLTQGAVLGRVTYDSADAPYAGVAAEQDGEQRAASQAAIQLRLQMSRYFAGRPAAGPTLVPTTAQPGLPIDALQQTSGGVGGGDAAAAVAAPGTSSPGAADSPTGPGGAPIQTLP